MTPDVRTLDTNSETARIPQEGERALPDSRPAAWEHPPPDGERSARSPLDRNPAARIGKHLPRSGRRESQRYRSSGSRTPFPRSRTALAPHPRPHPNNHPDEKRKLPFYIDLHNNSSISATPRITSGCRPRDRRHLVSLPVRVRHPRQPVRACANQSGPRSGDDRGSV